MERWEIIAGVLAVVAGAWDQVQKLWRWLSRLVIVRCRLDDCAAKESGDVPAATFVEACVRAAEAGQG